MLLFDGQLTDVVPLMQSMFLEADDTPNVGLFNKEVDLTKLEPGVSFSATGEAGRDAGAVENPHRRNNLLDPG